MTLCEERACRVLKRRVKCEFGLCAGDPLRGSCVSTRDFWGKSRAKRSFWRLGASLLEEVLNETLVLETWRFTFGESLVRNVRFGDLALHFWRKSRTKRSFWRLGALLLEEVSTKRSFWRLGASLLEEVSYETFVLETWRFTFGGKPRNMLV